MPSVVELNSTFTIMKTITTHVLDASGVTALTFSTRSCVTVYVEAAESVDDIINYDAVAGNPVMTLQLAWSILYVSRSPPYQLLSSSTPSFGLAFDCYVDDM